MRAGCYIASMDIEQLNKSQIVLLTLLVSFVTSIATGIVTVALMEQAPPAITQTVNRVIEHTVEKVVPGQPAAAATPVTKTVVVSEADALANAVSAFSPSVVRVYGAGEEASFASLGVVLDTKGTIAADASALSGDSFVGELGSGTRVALKIAARDDATGIAYLTPATASTTPSWSPAPVGSVTSLGQSVVAFSGKMSTRVGTGIVSLVEPASDKLPAHIVTNVSERDIIHGSPLADSKGNFAGMSTGVSRAVDSSAFVGASEVHIPTKESAPSGQ